MQYDRLIIFYMSNYGFPLEFREGIHQLYAKKELIKLFHHIDSHD